MRELVAAHFYNPAAPQAPARNASPATTRSCSPPRTQKTPFCTYNSHRKIKRPKLGDKKVYRPVRRNTLSRIDEAPPIVTRPRSKSLQHSIDVSSTRPILRSRSNISADTSRSVPVCNESHELCNQNDDNSPYYAEPARYDSDSSCDVASVANIPAMSPLDTIAYIPYHPYSPYCSDIEQRLSRYRLKYNKKMRKHSNMYLAFMY